MGWPADSRRMARIAISRTGLLTISAVAATATSNARRIGSARLLDRLPARLGPVAQPVVEPERDRGGRQDVVAREQPRAGAPGGRAAEDAELGGERPAAAPGARPLRA